MLFGLHTKGKKSFRMSVIRVEALIQGLSDTELESLRAAIVDLQNQREIERRNVYWKKTWLPLVDRNLIFAHRVESSPMFKARMRPKKGVYLDEDLQAEVNAYMSLVPKDISSVCVPYGSGGGDGSPDGLNLYVAHLPSEGIDLEKAGMCIPSGKDVVYVGMVRAKSPPEDPTKGIRHRFGCTGHNHLAEARKIVRDYRNPDTTETAIDRWLAWFDFERHKAYVFMARSDPAKNKNFEQDLIDKLRQVSQSPECRFVVVNRT